MKETGILRRIDELGRIVIPKEIRRKLKIREGDNLDIYVTQDSIVLKKYSLLKDLETILSIMLKAYKQNSNLSIIVTNLENIIASSKDEIKANEAISSELVEKIITKENVQIARSYPFRITKETYANSNLIIKPIIVYGDVFGAIILFSDFDVTNFKTEILDSILYFCIHYIES